MSFLKLLTYSVVAFMVGGIPFSYIITKFASNKDIRNIGSGNPGATNVVRALNVWYGILVLILDIAKGAIFVYYAKQYHNPVLVPVIAISLVLGHDFSPYLKFKGGKGVATSLGIFLILSPVPIIIVSLIFLLCTTLFKFVSFGSIMASISYPVISYFLGYRDNLLLAVILGLLIIIRHKDNLKRLWYGQEKKSI
ncbi:glycerol-3-phosphate 1-O-acyltransferase PlsY [Elusimicrobiota bacterium]